MIPKYNIPKVKGQCLYCGQKFRYVYESKPKRFCNMTCYHNLYRLNRPRKVTEHQRRIQREYRIKNHARLREYEKAYAKIFKVKVNARNRRWFNSLPSDNNYKIRCKLSKNILSALKGKKKFAGTIELIGCSVDELKLHLSSKFKPGMSWANHGFRGWHIDHIIPLASDLVCGLHCEFNLRMMSARENLTKSNSFDPWSFVHELPA